MISKCFIGPMADSSILRSDLLAAVEQNKVDKVRRILSSGIDANSVCDDKGRWPLHVAALLGHAAIVRITTIFLTIPFPKVFSKLVIPTSDS